VAGVIPSLASVAPAGPSYFWPDDRWEALSSSPGSGLPRRSRQPAAGAAGPSGGAGLLVLKPWGLLGCRPAYCPARGAPPKSSPRQSENIRIESLKDFLLN
jgi:hypothetical protein